MIPAADIPEGGCFRKKGGEYAYMRVSKASVKFHKLDTSKVYGVCFNGNMTEVEPDKLVEHVPIDTMDENRKCQREWHSHIGAYYKGFDPEPPKAEPAMAMIMINGQSYRCEECGANVFSRVENIFVCNGCQTRYRGE